VAGSSRMSPIAIRLALCAALLLALPSGRAAAQDYDFSAAAALLEAHLDQFPGGVWVQVVQNDRELFTFQGGGAVGPQTRLRLGSATKWLSSAVVLRLAEQGWLDLDDRIGDALPVFDLFGKGDVTVRQCFAMNSGLYETEVDYETAPWITLAQAADLIAANTPIVFPPGTELAYEGDGMEVVGRLAEVVRGVDWRPLATAELGEPLGLDDLDYLLLPVNPAIAGGARLSAASYQEFLRMVLRGGLARDGSRYLSRDSVAVWFANQTAGLPEYDSPWPPYPYPSGERPDYGHGSWIQAQDPGSLRVEEVSSPGVFGTYPWVDVRRRLRGIVAMDAGNGFATSAYVDLQLLDAVRAAVDAVYVFVDDFESGDVSVWSGSVESAP